MHFLCIIEKLLLHQHKSILFILLLCEFLKAPHSSGTWSPVPCPLCSCSKLFDLNAVFPPPRPSVAVPYPLRAFPRLHSAFSGAVFALFPLLLHVPGLAVCPDSFTENRRVQGSLEDLGKERSLQRGPLQPSEPTHWPGAP